MTVNNSKTIQRLKKLLAILSFFYFLYKFRKFLAYIRHISNEEHTVLTTKKHLIGRPSPHIFPNYFQNPSGLWIYHRDWILPLDVGLKKPKGIIILCHGYAEHISRYTHLAQYLNSYGFTCYGIDFQGHGNSDGDHGYFKSINDLINDLYIFSKRIKEEYPNIPLFVFGHSMGGLIVSNLAQKTQNDELFNGGIILSSPFFIAGKQQQITITPFILRLLEFVDSNLPKLPFGFVNNKGLSHDLNILYKLKNDKLHYKDKYTIRVGKELMYAGEKMLNDTSKLIKYPFLLFGGDADTLADPDAWNIFYNNTMTNVENKKIKIYPGLYHECLNETEPHAKDIFKLMLEWINLRCELIENNINTDKLENN